MLHTSPFNVNLTIMKPWLLMLMVYIITMMWNKQKNLLLLRVNKKLNLCLKSMKIVMMLFTDLKIMLYLNISMRIINTMPILMNLLKKSPLSKKRLILCKNLSKNKLLRL